MNKTIVITVILIAAGIYWKNRPQEEHHEEDHHESVVYKKLPDDEPIKKPKKLKIEKRPAKKVAIKKRVAQKTAKYPQLTKEFVPFDEDGNRYVTQVMVDGDKLIYHGDVLLGHTKDLEKLKKRGEIKTAKPQKWTDSKVPYVISDELPNPERVITAIDFMNQQTNIKFVPRDGEKNYVIIKVGDQQCYSNVGMLGGPQLIYLSKGCRSREVLHELMHTLGFLHEQNREDRDDYVDILWDNIALEHHTQFKKIPNDFLGISSRPFDYKSIMLYPSYAFSMVEGEPSMLDVSGNELRPEEQHLSVEDIERINITYPLAQ